MSNTATPTITTTTTTTTVQRAVFPLSPNPEVTFRRASECMRFISCLSSLLYSYLRKQTTPQENLAMQISGLTVEEAFMNHRMKKQLYELRIKEDPTRSGNYKYSSGGIYRLRCDFDDFGLTIDHNTVVPDAPHNISIYFRVENPLLHNLHEIFMSFRPGKKLEIAQLTSLMYSFDDERILNKVEIVAPYDPNKFTEMYGGPLILATGTRTDIPLFFTVEDMLEYVYKYMESSPKFVRLAQTLCPGRKILKEMDAVTRGLREYSSANDPERVATPQPFQAPFGPKANVPFPAYVMQNIDSYVAPKAPNVPLYPSKAKLNSPTSQKPEKTLSHFHKLEYLPM
jgi:hypothetical protein